MRASLLISEAPQNAVAQLPCRSTGPWISRWSRSRASAAGGLAVDEHLLDRIPVRRPFVVPSSGISRDGLYGTLVTHRPPSLPVGLRIIGAQQIIRTQVGYTSPRECGSGSRSACWTSSGGWRAPPTQRPYSRDGGGRMVGGSWKCGEPDDPAAGGS